VDLEFVKIPNKRFSLLFETANKKTDFLFIEKTFLLD
jgi:hypothetical protein